MSPTFSRFFQQAALTRLLLGLLLITVGAATSLAQPFPCINRQYYDSVGHTNLTDFDGDGIKDVGLHSVTFGIFDTCIGPYSTTNLLSLQGGVYGEVLVDAVSGLPAAKTPGDAIGPVALVGTEWRSSSATFLRSNRPQSDVEPHPVWSQSGLFMELDTLWVGVRFRTVAGTNYGWMKLSVVEGQYERAVQVAQQGYNPQPGIPATVGEIVPVPPRDELNWIANQPVGLFKPLNLVVETHHWRDVAGLDFRTEVSLRALDPAKVLSSDGISQPDGTVEASALRYYRRIPKSPLSPERWTDFRRVPLLTERITYDPATAAFTTNRTGLLAQGAQVVGVMIPSPAGTNWTFALHFDAEGRCGRREDGYHPYPIVGMQPISFALTQADVALDLDEDGQIDFVVRREKRPGMARLIGGDTEWSMGIYGLETNVLVVSPFSPLMALADDTEVAATAWPRDSTWPLPPDGWWFQYGLLGEAYFDRDSSPLVFKFTTNRLSYLGIQFAAEDGMHLGWLLAHQRSPGEFDIVDYSYNPVPSEPIRTGQRISAPPNKLRVSQSTGGQLLIEGQVFSRGWNLMRALQVRSDPAWETHLVIGGEEVGENRYSFRAEPVAPPENAFFKIDLSR